MNWIEKVKQLNGDARLSFFEGCFSLLSHGSSHYSSLLDLEKKIFDLSNLELRLKFQPNFYIYCKSSIKNRYRKVLCNYENHFQKIL